MYPFTPKQRSHTKRMVMCARCHKRIAVVFVTKVEKNQKNLIFCADFPYFFHYLCPRTRMVVPGYAVAEIIHIAPVQIMLTLEVWSPNQVHRSTTI